MYMYIGVYHFLDFFLKGVVLASGRDFHKII